MALPHSPIDQQHGLTAEDEASLAEDRIIIQKSAGGKRKVSAAFLTPPSSHESVSSISSSTASSSDSSTASVRFRSSNALNGTVSLPEYSESVAAIEFCGFNPQSAASTYARYQSRTSPGSNPDALIDYMLANVLQADPHHHMEPDQAMQRMGLSEPTRKAIMDPHFDQIRGTESIGYWASDTVRVNWLTLLQLQKRLKEAATYTRAKKKHKRESAQNIFQQPVASGQQTAPETATFKSAIEGISRNHDLPQTFVKVVTSEPATRPDHYVLYKGKAAVEMEEWILEDGSLNMPGLRTYGGGDFNWAHPAYYWTLERETAQKYCSYAATRNPYSEIWLFEVQVRKSFIDGMMSKELWYGHAWKEYVWYCRKARLPPARYRDFWKPDGADIIKGHICSSVSGIITNIKTDRLQESLTEDKVMTLTDGRKATQWCILDVTNMMLFDTEIKGKIHVDVITPVEFSEQEKLV
ncbi:MAG: hypothetical protein Q9207_002040 [Kuettlingeria erythrocarpa]